MRGEINHITGVPQAVAVLDLALGGVHAELGEDVFAWFETPKAVAPRAGVVVELAAPVAASAALMPQLPQMKRETGARVPQPDVVKPVAPKVVEEAAKVWVEGEAGGVLLLVQGGMPDSRCVTLAKAMMAAVGLQEMPVGWVGYSGKADAQMLMEAMRGQNPQQVMVLGQAPLGALLGRNLGVEGWHASDTKEIAGWDGAPVGVTYPLDLLMKQPLFKRLAWQHLLAWGDTHALSNELSNDLKNKGE